MPQASNDTPSGDDKRTPPSRQEFLLELWKDHKTILGFLAYLYLSAVGYTYDFVYYGFGYGLSIVKYVAFEDLVFSVLKHWFLIVTSLISLVILALILFLVTKLAVLLHSNRVPISAGFWNYCRTARNSFSFLWTVITTLYEHAVRALAASFAPINNRMRQLVLLVPTWLRWLFWLLTFPVHRTIYLVLLYLFIILGQILYYTTRPIFGALRLIAPIAGPLLSAGTILLPAVPFVLIVFFFVAPFWIAVSAAQQASANPPVRKVTVCTRWPQECFKNVTHIGSMGKFALFTEEDKKGDTPGVANLVTMYLLKWPTKEVNDNVVIIPLDNMSAFRGAKMPVSLQPTVPELLKRHNKYVEGAVQDIGRRSDNLSQEVQKILARLDVNNNPGTLDPLAVVSAIKQAIRENSKTVVVPEIEKALAALPEIQSTLDSLPRDTKTAVLPEIQEALAALPEIQSALDSLREDTRTVVVPEIQNALAALPEIQSTLDSLPQDTKTAVLPEIQEALAALPEIQSALDSLREDTRTAVLPEIQEALAALPEIQSTLDSLPQDTKTAVLPEIQEALAALPEIQSALDSLREDTRTAVLPEIQEALAALPEIQSTLDSLPQDTKTAVLPEIQEALAALPEIQSALDSLREDTRTVVVPEIQKALAALPEIQSTLDSLPRDTKTAVLPEIQEALAALPEIQSALDSLREDTRTVVVPEIQKALAALPEIQSTLDSLPRDTKTAVLPEIQEALAALPEIQSTLDSLPQDTKTAVLPEIEKVTETISGKIDRLAPEIPVLRHVLVERTTRRVSEVRYSLAGFEEGQHNLDSRQIGWLRDVHGSIVACRSARKTPQLVLVGYASSQTFAKPLETPSSYPGLCRTDQAPAELTRNKKPGSPLQNCYLANRRLAQVSAFLNEPFAAATDASEPLMRRFNDSCVRRDGKETIYAGLTARPWCNLSEMIKARAKNPQTTVGNQPDFFNRSVHIVVKNAGGCIPFSEDNR